MPIIGVPIRRILSSEFEEFGEYLIIHGDADYQASEEGIDQLLEEVMEANTGTYKMYLDSDNRGLVALTILRWGQVSPVSG